MVNLWDPVCELIEAAGLDRGDIHAIDIRPGEVTFSVLRRDADGKVFTDDGETVAHDRLTFLCSDPKWVVPAGQ